MDAKRGGLLAHVDDITAPVLERQGSCLQIHEQRGLRIQGLRLEGLADARRAKQRYVDLGLAGQAFFRRDDAEGHWFSRSEEHTSELQSLMRISYAVFCL